MARMTTIHILVDEEHDPAACDMLSELLRGAEGVIDWGYATLPPNPSADDYWQPYAVGSDYEEGEFLAAARGDGQRAEARRFMASYIGANIDDVVEYLREVGRGGEVESILDEVEAVTGERPEVDPE